ncbi:2753_t:CDS:1, partial [Racocetra fulgida]
MDSNFQSLKHVKTEKVSEYTNTAYSKNELQTNQSKEIIDNLITENN